MKDPWKGILIASLLIAFSHPVVGEVEKLTFGTDATWKVIDFENQGWTSEGYDDSWWESASVSSWSTGKLAVGSLIWYPGKWTEKTEYFRCSFEIPSGDIIYGILDAGVYYGNGAIELYLNDNPEGTVKSDVDAPTRLYITSNLVPGKNVIAAKVTVEDDRMSYRLWALDGLIRYNK